MASPPSGLTAAEGDLKDKSVIIINAAPSDSASNHKGTKVFELCVTLVKSLVWPLLLLILIFLYHDSIRETIEELPVMFSHAQKVSIGGLSLEIETQALQKGGVSLARVLDKLSPKDIEQLLLTGRDNIDVVGTVSGAADEYTLPSRAAMESLRRLEAKGLIEFTVSSNKILLKDFESKFRHLPWTRTNDSDKKTSGNVDESQRATFRLASPLSQDQTSLLTTEYRLTELGKNAFDSVITAVAQQLPTPRDKLR